jgi:uncharacterized protein YegL
MQGFGSRPFGGGGFDHQGSLNGLLAHMQKEKEKQYKAMQLQQYSKRGLFVGAFLLLASLAAWSRAGRGAAAGSGGGGPKMHCFFLLDRTGSMNRLTSSVKSGFNEFLQEQRSRPGTMLMSLAQFNSEAPFELRFSGVDVRAVAPLDSFVAHGTTPLLDALGSMIEHADAATRGSGSKVVIAVFTDGQENASRKRTQKEVYQMIEQRRKQGWTFVFLGATQDAFASASSLAVTRGATSNFVGDARGMRAAWRDMSGSTLRARKRMHSGREPTEAERNNYLQGFDSAERDYEKRKDGKGAGKASARALAHEKGKGGRRWRANGVA